MSIKLRAWDNFNAEMIYSDKFDDLYDFFYSVKRRENGGNLVTLMLASNHLDCEGVQIFEGDIVKFVHGGIRTDIVECRPEHFCYWQVRIPGDHFGLAWATNCCTGMQVIGNRYADREWLEDEGLAGLLDEASQEINRIDREFKAEIRDIESSVKTATLNQNTLSVDQGQAEELMKIFGFKRADLKKEEIFAGEPGVPISRVEAIQIAGETLEKAEEERLVKPICIGSEYQDGFGHTIKEGDILSFKLCGRRLTGEVKRIWSDDRYYWQVWTYESPKLKISLRHMCEDVACTEVRVIGHISTVRRGGVAVQDIGIQL